MTAATNPTVPQRSWRARAGRQVRRLIVLLLITYILVLAAGCMFQEKLLFPGAWMNPRPPIGAPVEAPPGVEVVALVTAGGQTTKAFFAPGQSLTSGRHLEPKDFPTIIYFYGNAMCLADTQWEIETFRKLPANVLIPELVGYGVASGTPSETGCYETAEAAYAWATHDPRVNPRRIVAMGWSLGAAVACDLASRHPPARVAASAPAGPTTAVDDPGVAGLIMCSAFTSVDDMARRHYWFLPTGLMLKYHFRSIDKIRRVPGPILLAHGTVDNIAPYEMSLALREAAGRDVPSAETLPANVTHLPIAGASHNDFYTIGAPELLPAVRRLLAGLP
jgi:fermentation-respiration switch protein FrsA (DUF1100 family)